MNRLIRKVAIITGASSGFGAGIAKHFIAEGASVIIADIQERQGQEQVDQLGGGARFIKCDVTQDIDIQNAIHFAQHEFGGLHIIVNNAGYSATNKPVLELTEAEYDKIFDVNLKAVYRFVQHGLPVFRQHKDCCFLNIASTGAISPRAGLVWYNASKGALNALTQALAIELAPEIRVNAINPVAGETPMLPLFMGEESEAKRQQFLSTIPMGRFSLPEDIASAAVYLCSSDASMVTGTCLNVDGGRCI